MVAYGKWRRWRAGLAAVVMVPVLALTPSVAFADAGVDTSQWQGCITSARAKQAKASGVSFAFVKATEGAGGWRDSKFDCSARGFASAGVRLGAYHFARPDLNRGTAGAIAEADSFINATRQWIGRGVIPVLDWEPGGHWTRQTWWAKTWLDRVAAAYKTKPLLYISASIVKEADWSAVAAADYGLWLAGYPRGFKGERLRNPGPVPYSVSPWKFAAAWQYSSTGNVPGVGSAVDVNWFYGDAVTWEKYANSPLPSAPSPSVPVKPSTPATGAPVGDVESLARAVIRGDYGNNPQRRMLLGSRYGEVMARVNQIMSSTRVPSSGGGKSITHVVRWGETISGLAARYHAYPLSAWRVPSGNINVVYPGNVVTYRAGTSRPGSSRHGGNVTRLTVTVRPGDSLTGIAARLGIPWTRLTGYRSGNPSLIYPGERLYY